MTLLFAMFATTAILAEWRSRAVDGSLLDRLDSIGYESGVGVTVHVEEPDCLTWLLGDSYTTQIMLGPNSQDSRVSDEQLDLLCRFSRLKSIEFFHVGYEKDRAVASPISRTIRATDFIFDQVPKERVIDTLNALVSDKSPPFTLTVIGIENWSEDEMNATVQKKIRIQHIIEDPLDR